jgi:hypothetical protein
VPIPVPIFAGTYNDADDGAELAVAEKALMR